jgi:MFS family permease
MADLLPAMLLGPLFGAVADRWSRKHCAIAADVVRAVAFAGIFLVDSFEGTLAFAVLAGIGTGLFTPAALASLPSLVEERRLPAATSLYGAITDLGFTAGPAIGALVLLLGGPETIMAVNGVTFALSAIALATIPFGAAPVRDLAADKGSSLVGDAREGLRAAARMTALRVILLASGVALFFGGLFNVAELPFVTGELDAGDAGFAVLVAVYGIGFITGSFAGASGGDVPELKRRYLAGLLVMAGGFLASGFAPSLAFALAGFAAAGFGNGLMLVYERLLIQATVPDELSARVFGVKDALTAWAFALAFLTAGALISLIGARELIVLAGAGGLLAWLSAAVVLRTRWLASTADVSPPSRRTMLSSPRPDLTVQRSRRLHDGSQLLHGSDFWLALLDDLDKSGGHRRVELAPSIGRDLS